MALVVLQSPGRVFNLETLSMKTRIFIQPWSDLELPLFLLTSSLGTCLMLPWCLIWHLTVVLLTPLGTFQREDPMCENYFLENVQNVLLTCFLCR